MTVTISLCSTSGSQGEGGAILNFPWTRST